MAYFVAERFAAKRGRDELLRFLECLKTGCPECRVKKEKCKLQHVARLFKLSVSEVCALRGKLLVRQWVNAPGLESWLKLQEDALEDKKAVILELRNGRIGTRA